MLWFMINASLGLVTTHPRHVRGSNQFELMTGCLRDRYNDTLASNAALTFRKYQQLSTFNYLSAKCKKRKERRERIVFP